MKPALNEDKEKTYEDKARELSGYDDAALLREAAAAECAWQQEKEAHPEEAARVEQDADLNFEILMSQINSRGLKPVSERGYERKQKRENRDIAAVKKINKKVLVLAAAVAVLIVGGSISAAARSGFRYRSYPGYNGKNNLYRSNDTVQINNEKLEDVYSEIEANLDIPVLVLGYMPEGMRFNELLINSENAVIELKYEGMYFHLKEIDPNASTRTAVSVSDRTPYKEIHNYWLNEDLQIEKNELEDGLTEYSVKLDLAQGLYYFSGITTEQEFVKMAENLMFR